MTRVATVKNQEMCLGRKTAIRTIKAVLATTATTDRKSTGKSISAFEV
jgi:hypothetical protein